MLVMRWGRQWIVVATIAEGDDRETEVFGPFTTPEVAERWCDEFDNWMLGSHRSVEHTLVTQVSSPEFVHNDGTTTKGEDTKHPVSGRRS